MQQGCTERTHGRTQFKKQKQIQQKGRSLSPETTLLLSSTLARVKKKKSRNHVRVRKPEGFPPSSSIRKPLLTSGGIQIAAFCTEACVFNYSRENLGLKIFFCIRIFFVSQAEVWITQHNARHTAYTATPNNIYDALTSHQRSHALMQIHPQGQRVGCCIPSFFLQFSGIIFSRDPDLDKKIPPLFWWGKLL